MATGTGHHFTPLVGRAHDVARLRRAVSELRRGRGSCIAISGDPGIGKTRMGQEAIALAAGDAAARTLCGRATELERDLPFAVVVDALDAELGSTAPSALSGFPTELLDELALVLPALYGRRTGRVPALQIERYRLHHAVRALLEHFARREPVLVVLDDLHWADDASLELVAHLLRRPPAGPVLLILASRSRLAAPDLLLALSGAAREGTLQQLELVPLSAEAAADLVGPADAVRHAALYRESGGNPLYLEQLARVRAPEAASASAAALGERPVPPTVQLLIEQEINGLSCGAGEILRAAAVAGDPSDPAIAAAIADVGEATALGALDEAARRGLVHATGARAQMGFRHPIVRRATYEGGGPGWRLAAHRRAAAILGRRGASAVVRARRS